MRDARQDLRLARESFASQIRGIILREVKALATGLAAAAGEFEKILGLLFTADDFAAKLGLEPLGMSGIASEVVRLRNSLGT
ncbi:MAG: hypothetical protein ABWY82_26980 [Tardiphaga sp.]